MGEKILEYTEKKEILKEYDPNDLKHLQQVELKILKEIISICESHNLKYYAHFGTALGAIRHGGFIPWDDDVDIVMFRDDYEKLLAILNSELNDDYHIINFYTEDDCFYPFTKICLKGTIFKSHNYPVSFKEGIFIDIFPLDNVPESELKRTIYLKIYAIYWNLMMDTLFTIKSSNKIISFIHCILHNSLNIFPGQKGIIKWMNSYLTRYNKKDTNYCTVHFLRENFLNSEKEGYWDKRDFEPSKKIKFEDIEIEIPYNYDKILTTYYGDYMTLPPVEKRWNHTPEILEFGKY